MYLMSLQAAGYPADEAASPDALDFRASHGRILQACVLHYSHCIDSDHVTLLLAVIAAAMHVIITGIIEGFVMNCSLTLVYGGCGIQQCQQQYTSRHCGRIHMWDIDNS